MARQALVQGGAQGVHIGAAVHGFQAPLDLFRAAVHRGAHDDACDRQAVAAQLPGQPEVHDEGPPGARFGALQHDVGGLHIPVEDAQAVAGVKGLGALLDDADLLLEAEKGQGLLQAGAIDEAHGQVGLSLHVTHRMHGDHVRVLDLGLGAAFRQEALQGSGLQPLEELQGDYPSQLPVQGLEHASHPAITQEGQGLVGALRRHGEIHHRRRDP
ncbi:MAG TPA: hypothetical protein PLC09_09195 [Holophaga sp.]|nr:hypothetical protein [Holophaga sp.]